MKSDVVKKTKRQNKASKTKSTVYFVEVIIVHVQKTSILNAPLTVALPLAVLIFALGGPSKGEIKPVEEKPRGKRTVARTEDQVDTFSGGRRAHWSSLPARSCCVGVRPLHSGVPLRWWVETTARTPADGREGLFVNVRCI